MAYRIGGLDIQRALPGKLALLALLFIFFPCNPKSQWNFSTSYFRISVDNRGFVTSMNNVMVTTNREFSPDDNPSPLLSLDSEKGLYYEPTQTNYNSSISTFILFYPNGSVAEVSFLSHEKYFKLILNSLSPGNGVNAVQWDSFLTNITNLFVEIIGVARDTCEAVNYAIALPALDDNALGGTSDLESDAAPFKYAIHSPDAEQIPLPDDLKFEGGSEATVFTPEWGKVKTISVDRSQFEIVKGNHNLIFECQFAKGIENVVKIEMKTMNDGDEISL